MICNVCGSRLDIGDYAPDSRGLGCWCEHCDAFNYYSHIMDGARHKFTLFLESQVEQEKTGDPPFSRSHTYPWLIKRVSPLRYPGGKTRLIDDIYRCLNPYKTAKFFEPYAGGASAGLSLLISNEIGQLYLNDADFGIYALFTVITKDPAELIGRIKTITPTRSDFFASQKRVLAGHEGSSLLDAAWDTLLVNRLAYSGIAKAHPVGGKVGPSNALLARWNPRTLIQRICTIHGMKDRIHVSNEDALNVIEEAYWYDDATILIDPPYVAKGRYLYNKWYKEDDHEQLGFLLESLTLTCPGADMMVFYDNDPLIQDIYKLPDIIRIGRNYSI